MTRFTPGSSTFPALLTSLSSGTGASQSNLLYVQSFTIATTANQDLDLAGSLENEFGETLTFARVKGVIVAIHSPDGSKKVRFGPQGVTNGANLWFQAATTNFYMEVFDFMMQTDEYTGWAITAGSADAVRINNPTGGSVTVSVAIWGNT